MLLTGKEMEEIYDAFGLDLTPDKKYSLVLSKHITGCHTLSHFTKKDDWDPDNEEMDYWDPNETKEDFWNHE